MTRITNYKEVTHALGRMKTLLSDGSYARVLVDNPRLTSDAPKILRVSVARKGMTFKVIEQANELGLSVTDVWQHDRDKKVDRIKFKLEPVESNQEVEQREATAAL